MTQPRIIAALGNLFATHAVVFWHDPDGEFVSSVAELTPEGISLLSMDAMPALRRWALYCCQGEATRGWHLLVPCNVCRSCRVPEY